MKTKLQLLCHAALLVGVLPFVNVRAIGAEVKKEMPMDAMPGMAKPANAAAALEAVRKDYADLTAIVKAKRLADAHPGAEKLIEALNALGAFTKELPADKRARVDGAIKNLAKALDTLHDAADGKNQAATDKALTTVDTLIALINAQYAPAAPAKAKN